MGEMGTGKTHESTGECCAISNEEYTTIQRGLMTHTIILAELIKRGYEVVLPWGDHHRYDLGYVEQSEDTTGVKLIRVQCKTAWISQDSACLQFNTATTHTNRKFQRKGYQGCIECFAVYSPDTEKVYIIPIEDVADTSMNLRLKETKNHQTKGIKWAKDYEL